MTDATGTRAANPPHSYADCELTDLWAKGARYYKTVEFITEPAIVIEDIATGERETHVISSPLFSDYFKHSREP